MTAVTHATRSIRRPDTFGAFAAFVRLEVRRALRNRRYAMFAVAFPVVFYALYTGVLSGASADASALVGGIPWRTYFMVSILLLSSALNSSSCWLPTRRGSVGSRSAG